MGAGGPTVPAWLAERVGPRGRVLATDIDVSWTETAAAAGVEVLRHDVAVDEPPAGPFDLIHARLVLVHVVYRDAALRSLANRLRHGFRQLLRQRGADLAYGRKLPRLLREVGRTEVEADAYFPITSPQCDVLKAATVRQVRDKLTAAGLATDEEIERHLANVAAGRLDLALSPMISAGVAVPLPRNSEACWDAFAPAV